MSSGAERRVDSAQRARLPAVQGEWIDRSQPLQFTFEGRRFSGFAGDTITSALAANGMRMLGRSFKYHRPRGILSAANHDVNAMVQIGERLNVRADVTLLQAEMEVRAVNTVGGLHADARRYIDRLAPLLPVGFYYKAFHTPKSWFPRWERMIRKLSGLGELDFETPHIRTPKRYAFCDVLVIGAGASGLSAALAAAGAGARVCVVDENMRAGGSAFFNRSGEPQALEKLDALLREVRAQARIELRLATEASGYFADHWVALTDAARMTKMRAGAVVIASGAFEQPAVFRNNDLPGVMLASAAQRLIYRYAVKPCERAVVLTANADGYRAALDLLANGIEVAALVDLRAQAESGAVAAALAAHGVRVLAGHCIREALAAGTSASAVLVCPFSADGSADVHRTQSIACDGVLMSVGWAPAMNLLYQAGMKPRYDDAIEQFVPDRLPPGVFAAGRVNGVFDVDAKLRDGERAGLEAARHVGFAVQEPVAAARERAAQSHAYPIVEHERGKNFVDFDEDLQPKDFANAAQEGFDNIELLKRFSTVGMGPSQGKHSNMNAIRILARIKGKRVDEIGTTTARPFFHPVPMSHLAGRGFAPERVTPMHAWHQQAHAEFMPAGGWLRPAYYKQDSVSNRIAIDSEVRTVRSSVGIIDVGTLGKLEVYGPQAGEFLERIYTGRFANMKVGTTRYALMLDESAVVIDDGVVARLSEEHFYFTTTTSNSAIIYRELARLNTMWRLNAGIVNVTGAYAAMNLAGPKARELLGQLTQLDLSEAAFPYLAARAGEVAGAPARLLRVGFVGELGYEIHVPAQYGAHVWEALVQAGRAHGIRAFGVEAQRLLRLEKGHIIIGQDTDGLTTPLEAALMWAVKMDKPFFIGQRSLQIIQKRAAAQSQSLLPTAQQVLAGFALPVGARAVVPKECHLVIDGGDIAGRVTSAAYSETLQRTVGLAYLTPRLNVIGGKFDIRVDGGALLEAEVAKTPFYDPEGARQRR
jgi:sarcosine oxidase subunit alpha